MHDDELEARLRDLLGTEGDALPVTVTSEELERRLSLRRRERFGRRFGFVATSAAVIAVVSALALSSGWLGRTSIGSGPSPAPNVDSGHSQGPAVSIPSAGTCEQVDPAALQEPPTLVMGVQPGDAAAIGGLRSAYRLGDRRIGEEGTWDHDSIGFESVLAGFGTERMQVFAIDPDVCLVGLRVVAKPSDRMGDESIQLAELTSEPSRMLEFDKPSAGEWFVQVHADFATASGTSAWAETFFVIDVPDCVPLDASSADLPTVALMSSFEGDGASHSGAQVAWAWKGNVDGAPGTWDGLAAEPDVVATAPGFDGLQVTAGACLVDVRAEALLTVFAEVPDPAPTPIDLEIRRGEGSPVVDVVPPPPGGWTVRIRAAFPTVDGSEAWSETLFQVSSRFPAPGLTIGPEFFEIMAEAGCPSYTLTTGASAADQCGGSFALMEGREPIIVASGAPLEFRLTDGWLIDEARTIAVDSELVARGEFAPEYSVDFQESVGDTLSLPIALDPGSWIVRITLNGHQQGDTFSAHYDIALTVTP